MAVKERLTNLQKELFSFAKAADHLNVELNEALATLSEAEMRTVFDLQAYLRTIARKAEYVAAVCVVKTEEEKVA